METKYTLRKTASDIRVQDPLSKITRAERKTLLGISSLGIIMVKIGLVPVKISALGIEFSQANQKSILYILAFINLYFVIVFLSYAASDYVAWRLAYYNAILELEKEREEKERFGQYESHEYADQPFFNKRRNWILASRPISMVRAILEFVLPIIIATYSIIILIAHVA